MAVRAEDLQNEDEDKLESELAEFKKECKDGEYEVLLKGMRKLAVHPRNQEHKLFLTHNSIVQNFVSASASRAQRDIFGEECLYFARALYYMLSRGYERITIKTLQFMRAMKDVVVSGLRDLFPAEQELRRPAELRLPLLRL